MSMYVYTYLYIHLSMYLPTYLPTYLSIYLPMCACTPYVHICLHTHIFTDAFMPAFHMQKELWCGVLHSTLHAVAQHIK